MVAAFLVLQKGSRQKTDTSTLGSSGKASQQQQLQKMKNRVRRGPTPANYTKVERFVLLGTLLSGEFKSLKAALDACHRNPLATHVQVNKDTGRAVVKTMFQIPREFGDMTKDNPTTLKKRCGEGYHPNFDTYVHPSTFNIKKPKNQRSWTNLKPEDFIKSQQASESVHSQLDSQCLLGQSGICKWNRFKDILFTYILPVAFSLLAPISEILGPIAVVATTVADVALQTVAPMTMDIIDAAKSKALAARLKNLKNTAMLSSLQLGGKSSYMNMLRRLTTPFTQDKKTGRLSGCAAWSDKKLKYYLVPALQIDWNNTIYSNAGTPLGKLSGDYYTDFFRTAPKQYKLVAAMRRFEQLPVEFWNCDMATARIRASDAIECCHPIMGMKQNPSEIMKTGWYSYCDEADKKFVAA